MYTGNFAYIEFSFIVGVITNGGTLLVRFFCILFASTFPSSLRTMQCVRWIMSEMVVKKESKEQILMLWSTSNFARKDSRLLSQSTKMCLPLFREMKNNMSFTESDVHFENFSEEGSCEFSERLLTISNIR